MDPKTVNESNGLARVLKTMQLHSPLPSESALAGDISKLSINSQDAPMKEEWTAYPHIFAVGDAADAFGAIAAGHNAYYQVGLT